MGKGILRKKNLLKRQYLSQAVKYIEKLEADNEALRGDPNTLIGQFVGQFRELYSQNSRLSVLAATLLKKQGDRVELTKEEMAAFEKSRINIKWELPDGVTDPAEATSYVFTYELQANDAEQPQPMTIATTETPAVPTEPEAQTAETSA